mmetsp:Transcript_40996/g.131080  ORF Transcript_40996/g.131080 Transcript_40996/m.131080 type:complete len:122 (-) Transcript_40996:490-855(-)
MVQAQGSSSPTSGRRGARPAEVYGFVGWVTSVVLFVVYLTWAYLPEPVLVQLGFVYYPSKCAPPPARAQHDIYLANPSLVWQPCGWMPSGRGNVWQAKYRLALCMRTLGEPCEVWLVRREG